MSDEPTIPPSPGPAAPAAKPDPRHPDARIGTVVAGKYKVLDRLARGGMARIYRAEQLPLGRIVALKELLPRRSEEDEDDPAFQQRFFLEASTLSKLTHPNTVRVFDYGQHEDGAFYMVMELVEGRTLSQVLRDEGALDPARAVHIAIEVLRSLQEAHAHRIIHRDLKPSNVMLVQTVEGEAVKVLDFGIAKVLTADEEHQNITIDDRIVGSPRYMAPEQIRHADIDATTDIYALGVVMFEMLAGRPPFGGRQTLQTLMAHLNEPVPSLQRHCSRQLPESLVAIVTSCLAKKQTARPQSVELLRAALREVLMELAGDTTVSRLRSDSVIREALERRPSAAPRPYEPADEPAAQSQPTLNLRPPADRRPALWLLALALLLIGSGGALVATWVALTWFGAQPAQPVARETPLAGHLDAADPDPEPTPEPEPPVLTLTSSPEGAEVWQGNRLHGVTPLELTYEPESELALELRLDGHAPLELRLEATHEGALTRHAELSPLPTPKPPPRPSPRPRPVVDDILIER